MPKPQHQADGHASTSDKIKLPVSMDREQWAENEKAAAYHDTQTPSTGQADGSSRQTVAHQLEQGFAQTYSSPSSPNGAAPPDGQEQPVHVPGSAEGDGSGSSSGQMPNIGQLRAPKPGSEDSLGPANQQHRQQHGRSTKARGAQRQFKGEHVRGGRNMRGGRDRPQGQGRRRDRQQNGSRELDDVDEHGYGGDDDDEYDEQQRKNGRRGGSGSKSSGRKGAQWDVNNLPP